MNPATFTQPTETRSVNHQAVNNPGTRSFPSRWLPLLALLSYLLWLPLGTMAGEERIVLGRSGPAIQAGELLSIVDPEYTEISNAQAVNNSVFRTPEHTVNLRLRYDESANVHFATPWFLTVEYTIDLEDETGTETTKSRILQIRYHPTLDYTDIDLHRFHGSVRGSVTINQVTMTDDAGNTMTISDDVYLDLEYQYTRHYILDGTTPPTLKNKFISVSNELELRWNHQSGADAYDLEWLFVDEGNGDATVDPIPYDWRDATRLTLGQNHYRVPLAYPNGLLIYRVRSVGVYAENDNFTKIKDGNWSYTGSLQTSAEAASGIANGQPVAYPVSGLSPAMNWQYAATFAEDGKRKEVASFFDGSLRARQQVTVLNTEQNAVVGETKYDYQGRPAVTMSPVPVPSEGMKYYQDGSQPFNGVFDRALFDTDRHLDPNHQGLGGYVGPTSLQSLGAGNWGKTHEFYSDLNTSDSPFSDRIPKAGGFPYLQVQYANDGTDRPIKQGGIGPEFSLHEDPTAPLDNHYTQYFYAAPPQVELDRLFGVEVGYSAYYEKIAVRDPNGQVSVQYLDQKGRTIASGLAGPPPTGRLLELDNKPAAVSLSANLLYGNNHPQPNGVIESQSDLMIYEPNTTYTFDYFLEEAQHCETCFENLPTAGYAIDACVDCEYEYRIILRNEDLDSLWGTGWKTTTGNPQGGAALEATTYQFTDPGVYHVQKFMRPKLQTAAALRQAFVDLIDDYRSNANQLCVPWKDAQVPSCAADCPGLCAQSFTRLDEQGNTIYLDENGNEYASASAQYLAAVAACEVECQEVFTQPGNPCDSRLELLKQDLSPNGQYYDNALFEYQADVNGNAVIDGFGNPVPNPNHLVYNAGAPNEHIDAWLLTEVWDPASCPTCFSQAGLTDANGNAVTSWAGLRDNWHDAVLTQPFANAVMGKNSLVEFHPEYCTYQYYCDNTISCDLGGETYTVQGILDYLNAMHGGENKAFANGDGGNHVYHYFNPFLEVLDTTSATLLGDNTGFLDQAFNPVEITGRFGGAYNDCSAFFDAIQDELRAFLTFTALDGAATSTTYSLWYVLNDPFDIAGTAPAHIPSHIHDFFVHVHGDANTPGILGSGPGQLNKYQLFRAIFRFIVEQKLYEFIDNQGLNGSLTCSNPYWNQDSDYDGFTDPDGYILRYPRNAAFELGNAAFSLTQGDLETNLCATACEQSAQRWLDELAPCTDGVFSTADLTDLREDLIQACKNGCDDSNQHRGSSAGGAPFALQCNGCGNATTFDDVITAYMAAVPGASCAVTVTHPNPLETPPESGASCDCDLLGGFIDNALTLGGADPFTLDPIQQGLVATALNNDGNTSYAYTAADVVPWLDYCAGKDGGVLNASYPQLLECTDCKCEQLDTYIRENDLVADPDNLAPADYGTIASALTTYTGTTYTGLQVENWLLQCESVTDRYHFETFPNDLRCLPPAMTDPMTDWDTRCANFANSLANRNAEVLFTQLLQEKADAYMDAWYATCVGNLRQREKLMAGYQLDEFAYTLYYYDQAGNLIKTVPPEGVNPISVPETLDAVKAHRDEWEANPCVDPTTAPEYPSHSMITNYRYNSYGQLEQQTTPDGGQTDFWYDGAGQLVASQNDRQRATDLNPPDSPNSSTFATMERYSYTLYDGLGRITEVGELANASPLTRDIAFGEDAVTSFATWTSDINFTKYRRDITRTFYETSLDPATIDTWFGSSGQQHLRNRVATTTFTDLIDRSLFQPEPLDAYTDYASASHYSYDPHGNVQSLIQENQHISAVAELQRKKVDYAYDLVSGNVNAVRYQAGEADRLTHAYCYDADNRLTEVRTSADEELWDRDARYFYYPHGPMARLELGDRQVQATDYAYTLQGWLKAVNGGTLDASRDIGEDGHAGTLNAPFGRDAAGFVLQYYTGDYQAVGGVAAQDFMPVIGLTTYGSASPDLYNGNIGKMITALTDDQQGQVRVQGMAYHYDQLNRIRTANAYADKTPGSGTGSVTLNNSFSAATDNGEYATSYHYDLNGNLTNLVRNGTTNLSPLAMDNFTYGYTSGTNRLRQVNDLVTATNYEMDIDDQAPDNYTYDAIGQLISDQAECILDIEWNAYNKIKKITRDPACSTNPNPDLEFFYGPDGNRIAKLVKPWVGGVLSNHLDWTWTFYARDAQGNVLATYEHPNNGALHVKEHLLYGAARLGTRNRQAAEPVYFNLSPESAVIRLAGNALPAANTDLMLHAGDTPLMAAPILWQGPAATTTALIAAINTHSATSGYSATTTGLPETIRITPASALTCPITVRNLGANNPDYTVEMLWHLGSTLDCGSGETAFDRDLGFKQLEISNHLGNVLAVVSDRKLSRENPLNIDETEYFTSDVLAYNDYYAFGMLMPGRNGNSSNYRFGFNTQEKDDEISGSGNSYTAKYWQYDSRLGRRWNTDPVVFFDRSPYVVNSNNPISNNDPNGNCDKCKEFLQGTKDGFLDFFEEVGETVSNPTQTLNAVKTHVVNSYTTEEGVKELVLNAATMGVYGQTAWILETGDSLASGNFRGAGKVVGHKTAEIATAFATQGVFSRLKLPKLKFRSNKETVMRVQGGSKMPNMSKIRFVIEEGRLGIIGDDVLFINVGQPGRALEFLVRRGKGAHVIRFKVNKSFINKIKKAASSESNAKGSNVFKVDESAAQSQFGIRKELFEELLNNVDMKSVEIITL